MLTRRVSTGTAGCVCACVCACYGTRHSSSRAGREMTMRSLFTSSVTKATSLLSERSKACNKTHGGSTRALVVLSSRFTIYLVKQLLQVLLQLKEVDGGDEALAGFGQAVPGQLGDLVVDEAEDAVGQRQHVLGGVRLDELGQLLLHLRRGLEGGGCVKVLRLY